MFASLVAFCSIPDFTNVKNIINRELRSYSDSKVMGSKKAVALEILDEIVVEKLTMNMDARNAKSRMQYLLVSSYSIHIKHGLKQVTEKNPDLSVFHVILTIRLMALEERLVSNLSFCNTLFARTIWSSWRKQCVYLKSFIPWIMGRKRREQVPLNKYTARRWQTDLFFSREAFTFKDKNLNANGLVLSKDDQKRFQTQPSAWSFTNGLASRINRSFCDDITGPNNFLSRTVQLRVG